MSQSTMDTKSTEPLVVPSSRSFGKVLKWIVESIPTILVLLLLLFVAYWGHKNSWKIPTFAELTMAPVVEPEGWCAVHNVHESECILCIPELLPNQQDFGWCKEHGVHQCPYCHPEVAQLRVFPKVKKSRLQDVSLALNIRDRKENNLGCNLYRSRIQFSSNDAVKKAGVEVELVETKPIVESIYSNGEVTYDETRVAHLSSRVPGIISNVFRIEGDHVKKGDVLAIVDSADVGKAKSELLEALALIEYHNKTIARIKPLYEKGIVTGTEFLETETSLQRAKIRLRAATQALANLGLDISTESLLKLAEDERSERLKFLGIPVEFHSQLSSETASNNLIPLVASLDGIIVNRDAVIGEVIDSSKQIFQLADTSVMWLRFRVKLEDAGYLSIGNAVKFLPDGMKKEIGGEISWISTNVDSKTRTLEVRATLDNPTSTLRNETFGSGRIILRKTADAVVVPEEAVQWDGSCHVVFVRDKNYFMEDHPKIFHTRSVRPGVTVDGKTELIAGVLPGEVVATKGSAILRSQILKNNLGAGCTCGQ